MTASTITRAIGYTGTLQRLVVPSGYAAEVTAYLWGGGGGGGGCDSQPGGYGGGSGYSSYTFNVGPGDIIDVAVGGGGGGGGSNAGGAGGGAGGASFVGPVPYTATIGGSLPIVLNILAVGGGGGGGGGSSRPFPWSGSGGGGADIRYGSVTVNPGDRLAITVAAGGTAGGARDGPFSSGAAGTAGSISSVLANSTQVVQAPGGGGGQQALTSQPAVGVAGSGGTGSQVLSPFPGTSSSSNNGGTGGKGYTAPADAQGPYVYGIPGAGGIGNSNTPGQTGTVYGGGGGGGGCNGANDRLGDAPAAGGSGLVVISYNTTNGVPVFSGGTITINGLRITHTFTVPNSIVSYSGGNGSAAGPVPLSGGGAGAGGATVLLVNSLVVAVAGGGGGGGGGGNGSAGQYAPGTRGQSNAFTSGQNGQPKGGDGGGAGGGGGGYDGSGGGGQGGAVISGDAGGGAGYFGGSSGDDTANPFNATPGNNTSPYYPSVLGVGYGGQGASRATFRYEYRNYNGVITNLGWFWGIYYVEDQPAVGAGTGGPGFAVLKFEPQSIWVKDLGNWEPVQNLYVKANDAWQPVTAVYVKQNNNWEIVVADNAFAPNPISLGGVSYGRDPRAYS